MRAISKESVAYFSEEELSGRYELGDGVGRILGSDSMALISLEKGYALTADELVDSLSGASVNSRRTNVGYEVVLALPKRLSIAWALGDDDFGREILQLHQLAVEATFSYIEATEISPSGKLEGLGSKGGCAVSFNHALSRSHDPHIHSHLLILNSVRPMDRGTTTALDARRLFWNEGFFRSIYHHYLRRRISELDQEYQGDYLGRCGYGPHLDQLAELFSSRKREIDQKASKYGGSSSAKRLAALSDRPQKSPIDLLTQKMLWKQAATEFIGSNSADALADRPLAKPNIGVWGALHAEVNFQLKRDGGIDVDDALSRAAFVLDFDPSDPSLFGRMAKHADRLSSLEYAKRILDKDTKVATQFLTLARPDGLTNMYRMAGEIRARSEVAGDLMVYGPRNSSVKTWKSALSASVLTSDEFDLDQRKQGYFALRRGSGEGGSDKKASLLLLSPKRVAPSEVCELVQAGNYEAVIGLGTNRFDDNNPNNRLAEFETTPIFSTSVDGFGRVVVARDNESAFELALDRTMRAASEVEAHQKCVGETATKGVKLPMVVSTKHEARVAAERLERFFSEDGVSAEPSPWRMVVVPASFSSNGKVAIGELSRSDSLELRVDGVHSTLSSSKESYFRSAHALSLAECEELGWPSFMVALKTDREMAPCNEGCPIAETNVLSLLAIDFSLESRIEFMISGWRPANGDDLSVFVAESVPHGGQAVDSVEDGYAKLVGAARDFVSGMSTKDDLRRARSQFEVREAIAIAAIKSLGADRTHFEHKLAVQRRVLGLGLTRESEGLCLSRERRVEFEVGI